VKNDKDQEFIIKKIIFKSEEIVDEEKKIKDLYKLRKIFS
jgi:hypothetical protein